MMLMFNYFYRSDYDDTLLSEVRLGNEEPLLEQVYRVVDSANTSIKRRAELSECLTCTVVDQKIQKGTV